MGPVRGLARVMHLVRKCGSTLIAGGGSPWRAVTVFLTHTFPRVAPFSLESRCVKGHKARTTMTTLWHDERVAGNPAYWRGRSHMSQPFVSERQRQMWGFRQRLAGAVNHRFSCDGRAVQECMPALAISLRPGVRSSTWYSSEGQRAVWPASPSTTRARHSGKEEELALCILHCAGDHNSTTHPRDQPHPRAKKRRRTGCVISSRRNGCRHSHSIGCG